jgi:hypothetical protein
MRTSWTSRLSLVAVGIMTLAGSGCGKSVTALSRVDGAASPDTSASTGTSGGSEGTGGSQGSAGTSGTGGAGGGTASGVAGGIAATGGLMSTSGLTSAGGWASAGGMSSAGGASSTGGLASASGGAGGAGATGAGGGNATGGMGSPDAGRDANMMSDSGLVGDAATGRDAPLQAIADVGGNGDGKLIPSCEEILFDNTGPPANYPVIYRGTASATDGGVDAGQLSGTVAGAPFSSDNTVPAVEAYLADWQKVKGYDGILTTAGPASCFSMFCDVHFTQNYCGLAIYSPQLAYRGVWSIIIYSQTGNVYQVSSSLVHMIPVPRNVLATQQQTIDAIVGQNFTYDCGGGSSTVVVVSNQDTFVIPPDPSVYVRPSPTDASALEYRLAIPVQVTASGSQWTVYVDAIDGSFLEAVADFICS